MSSDRTDIYKRARNWGWQLVGGRRAFNRRRRFLATLRRVRIGQLLHEVGMGRGFQAELARRLGVHHGTISRDLSRMFRDWATRRAAPSTEPRYDPATLKQAAADCARSVGGLGYGGPPHVASARRPGEQRPARPEPPSPPSQPPSGCGAPSLPVEQRSDPAVQVPAWLPAPRQRRTGRLARVLPRVRGSQCIGGW